MRPVWVGKRQGNRTPCLLKAQIFTGDGVPLADAQVLDLSVTGARVKVAIAGTLPETFQLHMPARLETRHCKLRWQRESTIGIEFVKSADIDTQHGLEAMSLRLDALEARMRSPGSPPAGGSAVASVEPSAPGLAALEARLERLEHDLQHMKVLVQDLYADATTHNLAPRFAAFEDKNAEILHTLRKLLPMLTRKAA